MNLTKRIYPILITATIVVCLLFPAHYSYSASPADSSAFMDLQTEIENKMPQIKDAILLLLSTKTFEDIKVSQGKLMLKEELVARLNSFLSTGMIVNIYFTSFVVQ